LQCAGGAVLVVVILFFGIPQLHNQWRSEHPFVPHNTPVASAQLPVSAQLEKEHTATSGPALKKRAAKRKSPVLSASSNCSNTEVTFGLMGGSFHDNGRVIENYLPCSNFVAKDATFYNNKKVIVNGSPSASPRRPN
jgi:hypothetical protein